MKKTIFIILFCLIQLLLQGQIHVVLEKIPNNTPDNAQIYMASSASAWKANDKRFLFQKTQDNSYILTLKDVQLPLEFKLTLGSWQTVELNAQKEDIANRKVNEAKDSIFISVENWKDIETSNIRQSTATYNVKKLSKTLEITSLKRQRNIWIYLPPDYDSSQKYYPVLYMQDGQNVFDDSTSYSGEWKVDELLNQYFEQTQKGFIVVAIEHGNEFRIEEYQPWQHKEYGAGKGKEYAEFLVKTVKPYIDNHYRTLSDASNTVILGSSMGGLISFYASMQYPHIFGKAGLFSPSFWIAKPYLQDFINSFDHKTKPKIYFLVGMLEGKVMYQDSEEIFYNLQAKEFKNITFAKRIDGKHNEGFWSREFLNAMEYLFPTYDLYEELNNSKIFKTQLIPNNQKLFFSNQNKKTNLKLLLKKDNQKIIHQKWKEKFELDLQNIKTGNYKIIVQDKKKIIYQAKLVVN